jgi:hypothetical protein
MLSHPSVFLEDCVLDGTSSPRTIMMFSHHHSPVRFSNSMCMARMATPRVMARSLAGKFRISAGVLP